MFDEGRYIGGAFNMFPCFYADTPSTIHVEKLNGEPLFYKVFIPVADVREPCLNEYDSSTQIKK